MQATVNKFQPGAGLAWAVLFPLKYSRKFDLKGLEGDEGIPVAADRVAFNTKAPKKTRQKIGTWSGKLSKYAVSRDKDEIEINEYEDAQTLANSATENQQEKQELVNLVYDDVNFVRKAMDYKVEIDCMRIGSSGVQTYPAKIEGDMASQDTINFNVPKGNFIGVSISEKKSKDGKTVIKKGYEWDDEENADGLLDLANAQNMIAKKGLSKPRFAYMEKDKFNQLIAQKKTAKRLYPQVNDLSMITSDMITLEKINAYNASPTRGYPQIIILDTYATIEHKNGDKETIKPWNVNVVTLSPTIQLGWTYYKNVPLTKDTPALQVYGAFYKVTRYSELNPQTETTMAEAYVQPALINRKSLVFLNTTNQTWADGESK